MSEVLHIDLETYSSVDLGKSGVYKYAESEDFEILLFAYAFGDSPVKVIDLASGESLPGYIEACITDPSVIKVAHNAAFERICLSRYLLGVGQYLDPKQWRCTMIHACELGLPASLANLGKALKLEEDKQKMDIGKRLITYFCKPCKPTLSNGGRTRNLPMHDTDKWNLFKDYNQRDVETEQAIYKRLMKYPVPQSEWALWALDQRINDLGIGIDVEMMTDVVNFGEEHEARSRERCLELTGGINIHSIIQLKQWISDREGREITNLRKEDVDDLLNQDIQPETRELLELRQETGKTSVKKYEAFQRTVCQDGRVHGAFQFYGGRTGRWAGRLVQPQNFPRNEFDDIELARSIVKQKDWELLEILYGSLNSVFSTLIRTLIVPRQGFKFAVADYSAIEARVIAWLTDETWRQEVFKNGGDIYCASATQMFHVPVEKHGQNSHLRKKGKVAELALGYGGGVSALEAMGGARMGLTELEMQDIVKKWRAASPRIRQFWYTLGDAVKAAIQEGKTVPLPHNMYVYCESGFLFVQIPSGRKLAYAQPKVELDGEISYSGMLQSGHKWTRISCWGGKFTENVVQAIARDCLGETLKALSANPRLFRIVMHVHDEVIVEVPADEAEERLKEMENIMARPIAWARGLILTADGFTSEYYKKD
ncbi:DNA polymerase [uncultured Faecalicoccus sp.]|uniref:DNA polymerase n=1 Tax=uncultured Faecalicoccus sp. TaxID=1971760 RepID=UPI00258ABBCA|nr:DNA polymerase [uncultured Faecalicoccus sp.]